MQLGADEMIAETILMDAGIGSGFGFSLTYEAACAELS